MQKSTKRLTRKQFDFRLYKTGKELLDRVDRVETDTFQDYPVTEAIETIKKLLRIIIKQTYELNNLKSE